MSIVPRNRWCTVPQASWWHPTRMRTPSPEVWLHHGAAGSSSVGTANSYAKFHIATRGWGELGYSFVIAGGHVLEGRGAGVSGAHTYGRNSISHGICIAGDYSGRTPAPEDLDALVWLLRHGDDRGWWPEPALTGGHRDAPGATTSCPGDRLHRLIPDINQRALKPDPEPEDDPMADYAAELTAIASNTRQTADDAERQVRIQAALLEDAVGRYRAELGMPPDPASDAIWASRITVGSHTLTDAKERLTAAVSERA